MYKTLRFICSVLSFQEDRAGLGRKVECIDDWPGVIECSTHYLLAPAFYWSLKRRGLLGGLPEDIRDYFEGIFELNSMRNRNLAGQAIGLCRILNAVDVQPLLLKGMANVFDGLYEEPGLRTMGDIDVLVPMDRIADCVEAMKAAGYKCDREDNLEHHLDPFYHDDYEAVVEVHHRDIVTVQYSDILPAKGIMDSSSLYETEGVTMLIPSVDSRVLHNIVHAQLHHGFLDMNYMQQMYDMVLFQEVHGSKIDWEFIRSRLERAGEAGAMNAYLAIAAKLFNIPTPAQVSRSAIRNFYFVKLHQASMSNRFVYGVYYLIHYYSSVIARLFHKPERKKIYLDKLKDKGLFHYLAKRIKAAFTDQKP